MSKAIMPYGSQAADVRYDNKNVTEASIEVGYESVSQFIRDYRKMFGSAAAEVAAQSRTATFCIVKTRMYSKK